MQACQSPLSIAARNLSRASADAYWRSLPLTAAPRTVDVSRGDRTIRGRTQQVHRHVTSSCGAFVHGVRPFARLAGELHQRSVQCAPFRASADTFGGNNRAMTTVR
jgi:hypothetical protein